MESKKINQLATELAPVLSDLTIIGDPTTGISRKITLSQMASLFTGTVEEYPNLASFPLVGTADTIYIALDTNVLYRWNTGTNAYVELSPNIINSLVFNDANGFDGTIALVGSVATLTITTALTTGSVGFIGASGALLQDNANFFWDDTNNRLGIGTNAPTTAIDVFGSGIIGRLNGTSTNNAFLGFASAGSNKWSIGNVQSDHRFRIYSEANTSELVSVLQTGEFGIGIANPTTKFHIDGGASALIANLDANVSVAKSVSFRSDNSNRFNIEVSGTESGSNVGADFFIRRYSDAGSLIDTPLTITRSTGNATFSGILITPQVKAATSAGLSINANSGTQVADFGAGGSANITFFGGLSGTNATFSSSATANSFTTPSTGGAGSTTWSLLHDQTVAGDFGIYNPSGAAIYFNASNNVGIGTLTPTYKLETSTNAFTIAKFVTSANQAQMLLQSTNAGSYALYQSKGGGTNTWQSGAWPDNSYRIGVSGVADYFTIATTGQTLVGGHTSSVYPARLSVRQTTGDPTMEIISAWAGDQGTGALFISKFDNVNTTSQIFVKFVIANAGVASGQINANGAAQAAFGSWSDIRLKENIIDIPSQLSNILALRPVEFDYVNGSGHQTGFIAQEMQEVFPDSVGETEEGYLTITGWNKTEAILVKAIQELKQELDELKAKVK